MSCQKKENCPKKVLFYCINTIFCKGGNHILDFNDVRGPEKYKSRGGGWKPVRSRQTPTQLKPARRAKPKMIISVFLILLFSGFLNIGRSAASSQGASKGKQVQFKHSS